MLQSVDFELWSKQKIGGKKFNSRIEHDCYFSGPFRTSNIIQYESDHPMVEELQVTSIQNDLRSNSAGT